MEHSWPCAPVNGHAGREGEKTGSCDVCQFRVNTESHKSFHVHHTPVLFVPHTRRSHEPMRMRGQVH